MNVIKLALAAALGVFFFQAPTLQAATTIDYTRGDSMLVVGLLKQYSQQKPKETAQLWFAKKLIGKPYVGGTLEVNAPAERLVVNLRQLDCTTLVNQVLALTLASREGRTDFARFCHWLQMLRYRDGNINGYASRLHYYSEAICDNTRKHIYHELGQGAKKFPYIGLQRLNIRYMSEHTQSYPQLRGNASLQAAIRKNEKALSGKYVRYIPKHVLHNDKQLKRYINNGDIIAIVTSKKGLDTSHLGFAVWDKGHLHLLNASSIHHKVVLEPMTLYQYMSRHPSQLGIRVIRLDNGER